MKSCSWDASGIQSSDAGTTARAALSPRRQKLHVHPPDLPAQRHLGLFQVSPAACGRPACSEAKLSLLKRQGRGKTLIWACLDGLPWELLVCVLKPGKHATPEQATPDDLLTPGSGPGEPRHGDIMWSSFGNQASPALDLFFNFTSFFLQI